MSDSQVSRRAMLAAGAVAAPAAAASLQTAAGIAPLPQASAAGAASIKIVTTYQFEPHEIEQIQSAAPAATKVNVVICNNRDEFRRELRDADVVYGALSGADLDYAPKVKWLQSGGAGMEGMDDKFRASSIVTTNYQRTFA